MLNEIDLSRADLNLLVLFAVVLEEGHVGRAAERLNLSPSAVSHGIGRLRRLLNDPLFLRTPKGVVPTTRAVELAEPVADILARARRVIASAAPFDPATSRRRFVIGAPDAMATVLLPSLLAALGRDAPGIDIGVSHLQFGDAALAALDARTVDVALTPTEGAPARFVERVLYREDFVVAMRPGHPYAGDPTLERYCAMQHLVVSLTGDPYGNVDRTLEGRGLSRRVALTVPNFLLALAIVARTDLLAALPRRVATMHGAMFGVHVAEVPLPLLGLTPVRALAPRVALMDAGIAWLLDMLAASAAAVSA
jgi:DNA-binding transcriptional LysR family regulator